MRRHCFVWHSVLSRKGVSMDFSLPIVPNRTLNGLYIILDCVFLFAFAFYFIKTKRFVPLIVGIIGGLLYFIVDYGGFYLLAQTRKVIGANTFWFLLWLSMSYGFTNMVWMWLWFAEPKNRLEYSLLIILWWFSVAVISNACGTNFPSISIERGTGSYHWIMAVFLFIGYALLIFKNLTVSSETEKAPLFRILAIGLLVQFSWEAILLVTGIRNAGFHTLIVNSLMETNLGAPYIYLIYREYARKVQHTAESSLAREHT